MFKTSVNARPHRPLTSSIYRERDPHKPYIAEARVRAEDLHRWQCVSIFISFHAIIFQRRTLSAIQTGAKTEFNAK